jgi:uncharacterized membrane protein
MTTLPTPGSRLQSVDLIRGVIMVLMAIDHVRVYSGLPAGGTEAGIFFTRWITHFCAPGFVFLAGTSAFLYGEKIRDKGKLATFLISRGLLLIILEMTIIRFLWSFNSNLSEFMLAGVIWMLGWCMMLMAALVWLRPAVVGWVGVAIIFGQQLFAWIPNALGVTNGSTFSRFWEFIYTSGFDGPEWIAILYVIIPWIGVMAAGYGFGLILKMDTLRRNKICKRVGIAAILIFLVSATVMAFANNEDTRPFVYKLLDQRKYPASQLYLLMTLGPLIALVPAAERWSGKFADMISVFGKVPFFYYLLHLLVIHVSALVVNLVITGSAHSEWYMRAPFVWIEQQEYWWSLTMLYFVFIVDVIILYFPCRWYAGYKTRHRDALWTKYL